MNRLEKWFESLAIGRRLSADLKPYWKELVIVGLLSLLMAGLEVARPWPLKWIIDSALVPVEAVKTDVAQELAVGTPTLPDGTELVVPTPDEGLEATGGTPASTEVVTVALEPPALDNVARVIWLGSLAAVAIVLLRSLVEYFAELRRAAIGHGFTRSLRFRIFSHLSELSPIFHAKHKSGDLLVRLMGDVPMVTTMMVDSTVEVATRSLLIVMTVGTMLYMDWLLTIAVFSTLPFLFLIVRWLSNRLKVAIRKQRRKEGDLADYLHEAIAATETIQALGGSKHVVRRFARSNRRSTRAGLKARKLSAKMTGAVESLMGVATSAVLLMGSLRVIDGRLTAGELLMFLSYVRMLIKPLRAASKHAAKIAKGTACGERILSILDQTDMIESAPDAVPAPEDPEELAFQGVTFQYEEGKPALEDFTATFRRGQLAALVGRSGAGKSTAASLAMRLFDPQKGAVLLDGRSLREFELDSMRERVGLCMQQSVLFGDSLRENLLLAQPEASDEELWHALHLAEADDFVRNLPEVLDTSLGSNGVGLSGGQKSRLSLARTLLREAQVLIVDEPFAGLDRIAARKVSETLRHLANDKIVVVIAHDLDRLELYDRVVFMDAGRKIDEGSHDELLERLPLYREIVRTTKDVAS